MFLIAGMGQRLENTLFLFLVFIEVNTEKCFSYKQQTGMEILLQLSNSRSYVFELPCNLPHITF